MVSNHLSDVILESLDSVRPKNKPQFQGPKSSTERQMPIAIINDSALNGVNKEKVGQRKI